VASKFLNFQETEQEKKTMTSYKELSKQPRKFLAMTGYTVVEFEKLLPAFQSQFEAYVKTHKLNGKPRGKRRYTDYKNSPLPTIEDKLLFILIYLKQGHLQEAHATLVGMHQSDANKWIHLLHSRLNQALAALGELPARQADELAGNLEKIEAPADEAEVLLFFHDGTERPIVRPKDQQNQQLFYSGKKSNIPSKTLSSSMPTARLFS
jgi:hypothetical protein